MKNSTYSKVLAPLAALAALGLATGCRTYQPLSMDERGLLEDVRQARQAQLGPAGSRLSLHQAASWMSQRHPQLLELRAEYAKYQAVADRSTPLPNPTLGGGPVIGRNLTDTVADQIQPFVQLGFAIPLGPRLGRSDNLNQARANQEQLRLITQHRQLYLTLRAALIRQALAYERLKIRDQLLAAIRATATATRRLSTAGTTSLIEVNSVTLTMQQEELNRLDDELELSQATARLAELLGVGLPALSKLTSMELPPLPVLQETDAALPELLQANNPALAQLKSRFQLEECQYRLELARQYPDLAIGSDFSQEPGQRTQKLGFTLGVELPIFNRNQQAIAEADKQRTVTQASYQTELMRSLTQAEQLAAAFRLGQRQVEALNQRLLPLADSNLQLAERAVQAGAMDLLRYLDLLRSKRELEMAAVARQVNTWQALLDLEQAVGRPLCLLPGETDAMLPAIIAAKTSTPSAKTDKESLP